jgi:integrase
MSNENVLKKIKHEREIGKISTRRYKLVIKLYTDLIGHDFDYLLKEAIREEKEHIPWRDKHLKVYLINFRNYLYNKYKKDSATIYFHSLKAIYQSYEIELHPLPPISKNRFRTTPPLLMKDLLKREEISKALNIANPVMQSLMLGLISMGIDKSTALNLTIKDLIIGTKPYHSNKGSVTEILKELLTQDNVVPTFYLKRPKTNKDFFTFASPEFIRNCCKYLLNRKDTLTLESPVFKVTSVYATILFENYNDKLKLGKAAGYNRLRGHMLRKYHATMLNKSEYMDKDMIDELQGREKQVEVRKSYYLDDPETMKKAYIKSLPYITINDTINVLNVKSDEYVALEREKQEAIKSKKELENSIDAAVDRKMKAELRKILVEHGRL